MYMADLNNLELMEAWSNEDESLRMRVTFPVFHAVGAKSTALVYFELEPGDRVGTHTDSAEEILLILEGRAEATVGDEHGTLEAGSIAVVPALEPHDLRNIGESTLRVAGFFSSNAVVSVFEHALQPLGERVVGTPHPELQPA
jgi:quercetin dioxygenase-like cupin family protein